MLYFLIGCFVGVFFSVLFALACGWAYEEGQDSNSVNSQIRDILDEDDRIIGMCSNCGMQLRNCDCMVLR